MATCSPTLLQSNPCLQKVTTKPAELLKLTLLCQILSSMATCDVNALMARSACFCKVTQNPAERLELQLLCEIMGGGGGGGGGGSGQLVEYTGTDPGALVPANQNAPAVAYSRDGSGAMYGWNTVLHTWG